jgi:hypothetical protein
MVRRRIFQFSVNDLSLRRRPTAHASDLPALPYRHRRPSHMLAFQFQLTVRNFRFPIQAQQEHDPEGTPGEI